MNSKRLLLRAALLATIVAAVTLAIHGYIHRIDQGAEASYRRDLRRLEALGAQLDRELLRSRSGLVMHYDGLTQAFRDLRELHDRLMNVPAALGFDPGEPLRASIGRMTLLIDDMELILEGFKAENAVLRNSRQYYPVLLNELNAKVLSTSKAEALGRRLSAVLGAVTYFDVAPAGEAVTHLAAALDELGRDAAAAAALGVAKDVELVLRHGRVIAQRWPVVDQVVAKLLDVPLAGEIAIANASYDGAYRAALYKGQLRLVLLAALGAVAIALGLAEVNAKLHSSARALGRAEEALEQERERELREQRLETSFVSATSRELRAPLAAIASSNQMLAAFCDGWDPDRRAMHFERIEAGTRLMTHMLDEVSLIGRAEMGLLRSVPTLLNLEEVCQRLVDDLGQPPPRARNIRLSYQGTTRLELDHRLFTRVLGNTLANALKYSESGAEVGLHVAVNGEGVHCIVQDSGIGIESDDLPHLFEPFYRGRNVGAVPGSGLGLAAAKRALDALGGTIEMTSEPGRGTQVTIWLPLDRGAGSAFVPAPMTLVVHDPASDEKLAQRWMWGQKPGLASPSSDESKHARPTARSERAPSPEPR